MAGTLYLVATPIGNLQDITYRALDILRSVDLIACEDTRHTRKLLNHFRISNRMVSYHEHNENERAEEFLDKLLAGESIALVSDAGTPGINDPGFVIVRRSAEAGIPVIPIPGPVAFIAAVTASGLPTDSLFFGGFLPSKKGERRKRLAEVASVPATLVFYEAPHRISKCLTDCLEVLGNRRAAVARELTKLHEEIKRGSLDELAAHYSQAPAKGEMVLVIDKIGPTSREIRPAGSLISFIKDLEQEGYEHKAALKKAAKEFGMPKSEAYRIVLQGRD